MPSKFYNHLKQFVANVYSLRFLFLLRLVFGYYFNVSKSKPISYSARMYCVCINIITCVIYMMHLSVYRVCITLEYIYFAVLSFKFTDEWFFKFCNNIKAGDAIMGFKNIPLIPTYMHLIIIINLCLRVTAAGFRIYSQMLVRKYALVTIPFALTSMNFNYIIITIIFSLLHSRMMMLRRFLEKNATSINISRINEKAVRIKNTRRILYNYDHLLDNIVMVNRQLQYMLFGLLVAYLPKVMIKIFDLGKRTFFKMDHITFLLCSVLETLEYVYLFFCPALLAELTTKEVDLIKVILSRQLTRCTDVSLRFELEVGLQYITLRPFNYKICRVVPYNINLMFATASLYITYVIVIIQFTHFNRTMFLLT